MGVSISFEKTALSKLGRLKNVALRTSREAFLARAALTNAGRQTKRKLERTTKTWDHRVEFKLVISGKIGSNVVFYEITTTDEIWHWLDQGTSIKKVGSSSKDPYISKTAPGTFDSFAGGGTMYALPNGEVRGGIEARHWSDDPEWLGRWKAILEIQFRLQMQKFRREMRNA